MKINQIILANLLIFALSSCATSTIEIHDKGADNKSNKKIVLFLDGTANERDSRTNISKLFEIIANQNRDNLFLFYNEGVGTEYRILGAATGWGLRKDVSEAYEFLANNYSEGSKLYIFGFSRGSYTARVLAGMLYTVGLYDLTKFNREDRLKISKEIYTYAYKNQEDKKTIFTLANNIVTKWKIKRNIEVDYNSDPNNQHIAGDAITIDIMGLWDTVEAMGLVPTLEAIKDIVGLEKDDQNIVYPNDKYIDQICNINNVFHVMSLDDNRAYVFTPIIMTNKHITNNCDKDIDIKRRVKEVWFSGAHADVGGGYKDNNSLSGISLNWILDQIKNVEKNEDAINRLIKNDSEVFFDIFGLIHDAENNSKLYRKDTREKILEKYLSFSEYEKFKIHISVKNRFEKIDYTNGYNSFWYRSKPFRDCINSKNCTTIEWVE